MNLPGRFLTVIRGWSLPISISSVTLGTAAAAPQHGSIGLYFLVVFGTCMLHACANTFNDYFDLKYGIDTPDAPTALYRSHGVFAGLITPKALLYLSITLATGGLAIGAALAAILHMAYLWLLIILGLLLNIFYTALPERGLKYIALGEPAVFLSFGPIIMEGSYAVQAGHLSWNVLLLSIPVGILVALVLFANNLRDREFDSRRRIRTLATLLGPRAGLRAFIALACLPYAIICAYVGMGILGWPGLFVLFSLPATIRTIRIFSQNIPIAADAMASEIALSFNFFLLVALITNILISF